MTALHVAPVGKKWAVRKSGADRVSRTFEQKSSAVEFARLCHVRPIYVHDDQGRIAEVIRE